MCVTRHGTTKDTGKERRHPVLRSLCLGQRPGERAGPTPPPARPAGPRLPQAREPPVKNRPTPAVLCPDHFRGDRSLPRLTSPLIRGLSSALGELASP